MTPLATLERPIAACPNQMPQQKYQIGQQVYTRWVEDEHEENPGTVHIDYCIIVGWLFVDASAEGIAEYYSNLESGVNYLCEGISWKWRDVFHESCLYCD